MGAAGRQRKRSDAASQAPGPRAWGQRPASQRNAEQARGPRASPVTMAKKYSQVDDGSAEEGESLPQDSPRWIASAQSPRTDSMFEPKAESRKKQRQQMDGSTRTELGFLWRVAWPTAVATLLRAGTQQVTVMFVGHLVGAQALGAVALGTMWVNISGLSIVFGGMSALDTLCSQAYGAKNYKLVGLWAQRGLVIIWCLCIPIFFLWFFGASPILHLIGIGEEQAALAQDFTRIQCLWMLPVFMNRTIQTYWRAQRIVKPYKNATVLGFLMHAPVCYWMTKHWGFLGAAWSLPINQWLLFFTAMAIDRYQHVSATCWPAWSFAACRGWGPLLRMGSAGTLTTMGEWWSWEICAGMAGRSMKTRCWPELTMFLWPQEHLAQFHWLLTLSSKISVSVC